MSGAWQPSQAQRIQRMASASPTLAQPGGSTPAGLATDEWRHEVMAILRGLQEGQETIMVNLDALTAADQALKAEVATFLQDIATVLTQAQGDQSVIDGVVSDINTQVASLQAGDPANAQPAPSNPPAPTPAGT